MCSAMYMAAQMAADRSLLRRRGLGIGRRTARVIRGRIDGLGECYAGCAEKNTQGCAS
jgi:hypothetical protein